MSRFLYRAMTPAHALLCRHNKSPYWLDQLYYMLVKRSSK